MDRGAFEAWLARYFEAWASNARSAVEALFAEDAMYAIGPFGEPWQGRDEIAERWIADPENQTNVTSSFEALAVSGDMGIAHWRFGFVPRDDPSQHVQLDGVLIATFDQDGLCRDHREWYSRRKHATAGET